jgi:hypothetical protein
MIKICYLLLMVADLWIYQYLALSSLSLDERRMVVSFAGSGDLYVVFREALHLNGAARLPKRV